ncbi:hypothetical protein [Dyella sp. ASV21]|nr:hypothetical protein [Dyella sp. ASV21]
MHSTSIAPKDTAGTAIAALHHHGVEVKVITGDNEACLLYTSPSPRDP